MSNSSDEIGPKGIAIIVAVIAFVIGLVLFPFTCVAWSIPPGHVGVVRSFGLVSDSTLPAGGPYVVAPWAHIDRVSVQTQKNEEPSTVPTKGGLTVSVKAVMLYHMDPGRAAGIIRDVGDKYEEKLIDPYFKNVVRDVCAEYAPEALYTNERDAVERTILSRVQKELGERGFVVEAVMLQDPTLPQVVSDRIQAKVAAEQDAIRMESVFKQRELEGKANKRVKELAAEAQVIEAKGIAEAQKIIKQDLSHEYLVYLWVQALKENHGATIYVPTGTDGMPFFRDVRPEKK